MAMGGLGAFLPGRLCSVQLSSFEKIAVSLESVEIDDSALHRCAQCEQV